MSELSQSSNKFSRIHFWLWTDLNWVWILVAIAWVLLLTTNHSHLISETVSSLHPEHSHSVSLHHSLLHSVSHHSSVIEQPDSNSHTRLQTGLHHLASWETMLVAMMLPSVLPVARLFLQVNHQQNKSLPDGQTAPSLAPLAFVASYLLIWTIFACGTTAAQLVLPGVKSFLLHSLPLLQLPTLPLATVQGGVLVGVGLFQFTAMKRNCLKGCRSAAMVIAQYYQPGWQGGWHLGIQHGLYCLGCCWALMVSMVVMGMEDLSFMLLLTAIMTLERIWQYGEQLAIAVGVGLIGWGGWLLLHGML